MEWLLFAITLTGLFLYANIVSARNDIRADIQKFQRSTDQLVWEAQQRAPDLRPQVENLRNQVASLTTEIELLRDTMLDKQRGPWAR
jgi:hypothetical protein